MFLKALRLKNVRSIRDLELSFASPEGGTRKWTLLLGENGTGKSTVLRAIALIMAGENALPHLLLEPSSWVRLRARTAVIEAEVVTARGEPRSLRLVIRRGRRIAGVLADNRGNLAPLQYALNNSPFNYLTVGYGASRRPEVAQSSADASPLPPRAQAVGSLFRTEIPLNALETWAMDLDYQDRAFGFATVRAAISDLLPGVKLDSIDKRNRRLIFRTADGLVPMSQLSDGYQNVAAWAGDLLFRINDLSRGRTDPLKARGLLLLDEIDLHLHPVWQRRLHRYLAATLPNLQIVATTHSALAAQQTGEGELYALRRPRPNQPPGLVPFRGAARRLMVHQLLLSEVFGLSTIDSDEVESAREEYESLRAAGKGTARAKRRLAELEEMLRDLPNWGEPQPQVAELHALLKKIHRKLPAKVAEGA